MFACIVSLNLNLIAFKNRRPHLSAFTWDSDSSPQPGNSLTGLQLLHMIAPNIQRVDNRMKVSPDDVHYASYIFAIGGQIFYSLKMSQNVGVRGGVENQSEFLLFTEDSNILKCVFYQLEGINKASTVDEKIWPVLRTYS